jgi:hypothetical protein
MTLVDLLNPERGRRDPSTVQLRIGGGGEGGVALDAGRGGRGQGEGREDGLHVDVLYDCVEEDAPTVLYSHC